MPALSGVDIELHCQQNISSGGPIEEFAPRKRNVTDLDGLFMPNLYDRQTQTCSVFIPVFPRAQFFLKYRCQLDPSRSDPTAEQFFVFQLFIGKDEITTWSCGEKQAWQGKTCFAMYDTSSKDVNVDGKIFEKRIFMFNGDLRVTGDMQCDKDQDRKIEVRVFRADRSMRAPREPGKYEGQGMVEGIRTPAGSEMTQAQPKKFHLFGLMDPIDKPYATFRWYYRTWGE